MRLDEFRAYLVKMHDEEVLDLRNSSLTDEHMGLIIDFARVTNPHSSIILSGNKFTDVGIASLATFLSNCNHKPFSAFVLSGLSVSLNVLVKLVNVGIEKQFNIYSDVLEEAIFEGNVYLPDCRKAVLAIRK